MTPPSTDGQYPITVGELYRIFTRMDRALSDIDGKVDNLVTKSEFESNRADHEKRLKSLEKVEPVIHVHTEKIDRLYTSLWWVVTTVLSLIIVAVIGTVLK